MTSRAKIHDRDGEVLELGAYVCSAKVIATHLRPNLDACLAVWICQRLRENDGQSAAEVIFVPSNVTHLPTGVFGVHVGRGRGVHKLVEGYAIKQSAIGGSPSLALYRLLEDEQRSNIESVVRAVSDADKKWESIHTTVLKGAKDDLGHRYWDRADIRAEVLDTTMWAVHYALMQQCSDAELIKAWHTIFSGMSNLGDVRKEAERAADRATYLAGGIIAVLPHNAPQQAGRLAFDKGVYVVVFSSQISAEAWTLGAVRRSHPQRLYDFDRIRDELTKAVPGIFVHSEGRMTGWTNKAPLYCDQEHFTAFRNSLIACISKTLGQPHKEKKGER